MKKFYITKYALTNGIEHKEAEECGDNMIRTKEEWPQYHHKEGRDWHRTMEDAALRAEKMREAKILSLKKAIKKMESLKF